MAGVVDADTHVAESGPRSQQDITVFKNNGGQGIAELATRTGRREPESISVRLATRNERKTI
jgi:hypothetical protein